MMPRFSGFRFVFNGIVPRFLALIGSGLARAELPRVLVGNGLAEWPKVEPSRMLNAWLSGQVDAAPDRRLARVETLFEDADVAGYQRDLLEVFILALGGLPERTPTGARVTGVIRRDKYRVDKILYESQPGFPVTATLYLPERPGPHPGVLHTCGHGSDGKAAERCQRATVGLRATDLPDLHRALRERAERE